MQKDFTFELLEEIDNMYLKFSSDELLTDARNSIYDAIIERNKPMKLYLSVFLFRNRFNYLKTQKK